jgi:DGQHR domain-containing protein
MATATALKPNLIAVGAVKPAKKTKKTKKAAKKSKKVLSPQEKEQRRLQRKQVRDSRSTLGRLGFQHITVDKKEFTFRGRTGELDDLFVYENLVVVFEYTVGSAGTEHIFKKKVLFDLIGEHAEEFVQFLRQLLPSFDSHCAKTTYQPEQFRCRIVYFATDGVSDEAVKAMPAVKFLSAPHFRYFQLLSKTLHKTARFELFKYLELPQAEVGEAVFTTSTSTKRFSGYLLPESHSSFPVGFKVTSFYADPSSLMRMSYVLRRDSWRDTEGLYQRILIPSKIRSMRRYLAEQKRVFVNNVIVTLPANTSIDDPSTKKNLDPKLLNKVQSVLISVDDIPDVIGIVDGQHRVFCYHEGVDKQELQIAKLREQQNLLVTGIVFPDGVKEADKLRFQAKLFLEINDEQTGAKSDLKQAIELILHPYSSSAIAKAVITRLSQSGPLRDLLQTNVFDLGHKIKTTSIVSYGLKPLLKFEGEDTLYRHWTNPQKEALPKAAAVGKHTGAQAELDAYVEFCAAKINDFLLAVKLAQIQQSGSKWQTAPKGGFPTPTVINGLLVCMRRLAENKKIRTSSWYQGKLSGIAVFDFTAYKSSQWRAMGDSIYSTFFE